MTLMKPFSMKRVLQQSLLALTVAAAGTAAAAPFSLNLGGSLGGGAGLHFGLTDQNLFTLGAIPIDGRISADANRYGVLVNADALAVYDAGSFTLYGGPGITLGGGNGLGLALTGGLNYPLTDQFGLYAEAAVRLLNTAPSVLRVGVTYDF